MSIPSHITQVSEVAPQVANVEEGDVKISSSTFSSGSKENAPIIVTKKEKKRSKIVTKILTHIQQDKYAIMPAEEAKTLTVEVGGAQSFDQKPQTLNLSPKHHAASKRLPDRPVLVVNARIKPPTRNAPRGDLRRRRPKTSKKMPPYVSRYKKDNDERALPKVVPASPLMIGADFMNILVGSSGSGSESDSESGSGSETEAETYNAMSKPTLSDSGSDSDSRTDYTESALDTDDAGTQPSRRRRRHGSRRVQRKHLSRREGDRGDLTDTDFSDGFYTDDTLTEDTRTDAYDTEGTGTDNSRTTYNTNASRTTNESSAISSGGRRTDESVTTYETNASRTTFESSVVSSRGARRRHRKQGTAKVPNSKVLTATTKRGTQKTVYDSIDEVFF